MILNGGQPPLDSLWKIKADDIQAKFLEISKPWNVSQYIYQKHLDTISVFRKVANSLQSF